MHKNKRILWRIGAVILLIMLFQALFDPLSGIQHLSARLQARLYLPSAREKWETQGIRHYRFDIRGYVPLVCMFGGGIEVKNGVVRPGPRSDADDPSALLSPGFSDLEEPALCDYRNYTMPLLFDEVEHWLIEGPEAITQVSFDPQYGFISSFSYGSSGGRGVFNPTVSDCCGGFTIENFQVLDN